MTADIKEQVFEAAIDVANDACKQLRQDSPKDSKKYARSWGVEKVISKTGAKTVVVRNKSRYQLTHLLEFGHVNRDGTRAKAVPHIAKVNDEAAKKFEEKVVGLINGL